MIDDGRNKLHPLETDFFSRSIATFRSNFLDALQYEFENVPMNHDETVLAGAHLPLLLLFCARTCGRPLHPNFMKTIRLPRCTPNAYWKTYKSNHDWTVLLETLLTPPKKHENNYMPTSSMQSTAPHKGRTYGPYLIFCATI